MQLMRKYDITPDEVEAALLALPASVPAQHSRGEIAKTLFIYSSAIFIFAGIGIYISTFWENLV